MFCSSRNCETWAVVACEVKPVVWAHILMIGGRTELRDGDMWLSLRATLTQRTSVLTDQYSYDASPAAPLIRVVLSIHIQHTVRSPAVIIFVKIIVNQYDSIWLAIPPLLNCRVDVLLSKFPKLPKLRVNIAAVLECEEWKYFVNI